MKQLVLWLKLYTATHKSQCVHVYTYTLTVYTISVAMYMHVFYMKHSIATIGKNMDFILLMLIIYVIIVS